MPGSMLVLIHMEGFVQQSTDLGFAGLDQEAVGEDLFDRRGEYISKRIDQEMVGGLLGSHARRPGIAERNGKVLRVIRLLTEIGLSIQCISLYLVPASRWLILIICQKLVSPIPDN